MEALLLNSALNLILEPIVTSPLECVLVLWMKLGLSLDSVFSSREADNPFLTVCLPCPVALAPPLIVIAQVRIRCLIRVMHVVAV